MIAATEIRLAKSAPWATDEEKRSNRLLRAQRVAPNAGQSIRFAYVDGRRFRIEREDWGSLWFVSEVFENGEDIWVAPDGTATRLAYERGVDNDFKFLRCSVGLDGIRRAIAEEVSR